MFCWIIYFVLISLCVTVAMVDGTPKAEGFLSCNHKWSQRLARLSFVAVFVCAFFAKVYPQDMAQGNSLIFFFFQYASSLTVGFVLSLGVAGIIQVIRWTWK